MRSKSSPSNKTDLNSKNPLLHLWILRILVTLNGQNKFITASGFFDDSMAEELGLGEFLKLTSKKFDQQSARNMLRDLHEKAESNSEHIQGSLQIQANLSRLAELAGMTDVDCKIVEFIVTLKTESWLEEFTDLLGTFTTTRLSYCLSCLLSLPEREIRAAMSPQSTLIKSGIVAISNGVYYLNTKIDLLSSSFADCLAAIDSDPIDLLKDIVSLSSAPTLSIEHYEHIQDSLAILKPYLLHSVRTQRKAVNVLIYGSPGTGKSQLAKVLANEFGCELYEISCQDTGGDFIDGEKRLRAFRAAQAFFSRRKAMILFDEVEDVFNNGDRSSGRKSTAQQHKAWINRSLEENPVPSIWISNSIHGLDPAFIRRFDIIVELPVPPKKQRTKIIAQASDGMLNRYDVQQISESNELAPAVMSRAASVVRAIRNELGEQGAATAIKQLINNTLEAQYHKPIISNESTRLPEIYDPAFVNTNVDLNELAVGLAQTKSGRICLYGPPGTGKTAYGKWLADQLEMPIIIKRASDIISMWVGGTEKNIAEAFKKAAQDGALLMIDEIDTFLQDRRNAQRSWEVSDVNEMLTQIESFNGVFIASTNLMNGLDQAALRRFDLKAKFDFMKAEQSLAMFERYCDKLNFEEINDVSIAKIRRLPYLTPGDFSAVMRQNKFRPLDSAAKFIQELEHECSLKEVGKNSIGFV